MKISLVDRSLYLKGLMLLIRKDRKIRDEEENMMLCVGKMLGFNEKFCEDTIKEILHNKYVVDEPPRFSRPDIAKYFVRDALRISLANGEAHEKEVQWVKAVAVANGIEEGILDDLVHGALDKAGLGKKAGFEVEGFEWE